MTTNFRDQDWNVRYQSMGDEAEAKFEEVSRTNWVRTGLNRPPIALGNVPDKVRFMPDYLRHDGWVEVMGYGRDGILKCKTRKWAALHEYDDEWIVYLFLWDRANQTHYLLTFQNLLDCMDCAELDVFPEGNKYWGFRMRKVIECLGLSDPGGNRS